MPTRGGSGKSIGEQIMMAIVTILMTTEGMMIERGVVDMKTMLMTIIIARDGGGR